MTKELSPETDSSVPLSISSSTDSTSLLWNLQNDPSGQHLPSLIGLPGWMQETWAQLASVAPIFLQQR